MTPQNQPRDTLLERILERITSIDAAVDEIRDQLADHLDELRYHHAWDGKDYDFLPNDDYNHP